MFFLAETRHGLTLRSIVSGVPLASPVACSRRSQEEDEQEEQKPQELANFGLSGKLAKDQTTGNVYKGVVLKVGTYLARVSFSQRLSCVPLPIVFAASPCSPGICVHGGSVLNSGFLSLGNSR